MKIKVNVDLSSANNFGSGICVFENEIVSRLATSSSLALHGCANYRRAFSKADYARFPFDVTYSKVPHKLVYNHYLPISYDGMMKNRADVSLFCTYVLPNVRYNGPVISCIHDIILIKTKAEAKKVIEHHDKVIRHTIDNSSAILTVSNATKADLIDIYGVSEDKITVVYNGVDSEVYNKKILDEEKTRVKKKYGLPEKFFLYFGGIRKHKNVDNIIRAYAMLDAKDKEEIKLVITNGSNSLKQLVCELGEDNNVIFTGFIDDTDKVAIYQLAMISMFVSFYEGFGIPIIEAMAAGTPVITSNTSSMPEAAGDAALLVNPYSVEEISQAMKRLISDPTLYNELVLRGYKNARRFDWDKSAKIVEDLIIKTAGR
ncbi:glycosyltransferase family 4 protein [Neobacillus sp. KR4-4]|uniref:glycosyltransferase family 4 protein n=1 Tax=Neobacillus sp. KR4-4 TaxID=3344872 RepID=UPI0035CBC726